MHIDKEKIWWRVRETYFLSQMSGCDIESTLTWLSSDGPVKSNTFLDSCCRNPWCTQNFCKQKMSPLENTPYIYTHTALSPPLHFAFWEKKIHSKLYWWVCYQNFSLVRFILNILQISNNLTHNIVEKVIDCCVFSTSLSSSICFAKQHPD